MFQEMMPMSQGGAEIAYSSYIEENCVISTSPISRTIPNNKTKDDVLAIITSITFSSGSSTDTTVSMNENGTLVNYGNNTCTFTSDTTVSILCYTTNRTTPIIWLFKE